MLRRWWLLVWCFVLTSTARTEQSLVVGGFANSTLVFFRPSPTPTGVFVSWQWTREHLGLGGGLRLAAPAAGFTVPLEAFVRGVFTIAIGPWRPLLAPELGVSGLSSSSQRPMGPLAEIALAENASAGPLYVAFHTELLRFSLGRVLVSAAGFDVGTTLSAPGAALRLQVDVLSVGVRW